MPYTRLEEQGQKIVEALCAGGPQAQTAAKDLISGIAGRPLDDALVEDTAQRIAKVRASAEGKEGVSAFLEKRPPEWV